MSFKTAIFATSILLIPVASELQSGDCTPVPCSRGGDVCKRVGTNYLDCDNTYESEEEACYCILGGAVAEDTCSNYWVKWPYGRPKALYLWSLPDAVCPNAMGNCFRWESRICWVYDFCVKVSECSPAWVEGACWKMISLDNPSTGWWKSPEPCCACFQ